MIASAFVSFGRVQGAVGCLLAILQSGGPLAAQELAGRLQAREPARPLAGVVVTANRASDGALVARTLTGAHGEYMLPATTDSLIIRALRIGQQPVVLGLIRLTEGERRRIDSDLPEAPVALALHRTLATDRCQLRRADGDVVGQLFYAARSAILATGASTSDGPPRSVYRLVREQWNARGDRVDSLTEVTTWAVEALQPFRSVPVDSLLSGGWVVPQPDGSTVYRGLDAEVLLDDRFLARYCLRLAQDSATAPDVIGVHFQPARRARGRVDIEGALWLDRESLALRTLAFRYTELDPVAASTNPGGTIEFAAHASGGWFISAWSLRMPLVLRQVAVAPRSTSDAPSAISERRILLGRQSQSGQVLRVETGGRLQFVQPERLAPVNEGAVDRAAESQPCRLYGHLRTLDGNPLSNAMLELFEHGAAYLVEVPRLLDIARTDSVGRFALCPGGPSRLALVRTSADTHGVDSIVVGAVSPDGSYGLSLVWAEAGLMMPAAAVVERLSTLNPTHSESTGQRRRDGKELLGPPRESAVDAATSTAVSTDSMVAAAASRAASQTWLLVIDRDSISIPFASVAVGGGRTRITAEDGHIPLTGVRGAIDVEVRRIGYAPYVGRLAPDTIDGRYRVTLTPAGQQLGAVEVVAPRVTPLSRTGFYGRVERVRRGAILGAFLTPEEIERRPSGTAADLLGGLQYVWAGGGIPTGRASCRYQVLVDGMPNGPSLREISANEVMGIEVYPSTANAPVELIPVTNRGSCGIIAIWLGPRR